MKDDNEFLNDETYIDRRSYSKEKQFRQSNRKSFQILLGIFIILIFVVSLIYFISRLTAKGGSNIFETRLIAIEQKIQGFEKQLGELQEKITTSRPDEFLQRLESMEKRLQQLENQRKQPTTEAVLKPQSPQRTQKVKEKNYHIVQKGETLYKIAKKYNMSIEELRKLNGLKEGKPIKVGEKLIVSQER